MITRTLLVLSVYATPMISFSQEVEKLEVIEELSPKELKIRNTTKWAACIPSSGQIINKKYWKAPLVLGGLATSVYFITDNTRQMNEFREAWRNEADDDPLTVSNLRKSNGDLYNSVELEDNTYLFRRYRDLSYLSFLGVYLLQIVDAHVDAHMRFFDADEDLSLFIVPPHSYRNRTDIWQVGLKFNFSKNK